MTKAETDRFLAERLEELKAIQAKVARSRGPYVAAICGRGGESDMNWVTLRDLYVAPAYGKDVYVEGPGGTKAAATIGCRKPRCVPCVAETTACVEYLKRLGFKVRAIVGDPTSFRVS